MGRPCRRVGPLTVLGRCDVLCTANPRELCGEGVVVVSSSSQSNTLLPLKRFSNKTGSTARKSSNHNRAGRVRTRKGPPHHVSRGPNFLRKAPLEVTTPRNAGAERGGRVGWFAFDALDPKRLAQRQLANKRKKGVRGKGPCQLSARGARLDA